MPSLHHRGSKGLTLLIWCLAGAVLLAACGQQSPPQPQPAAKPAAAPAPSAPAQAKPAAPAPAAPAPAKPATPAPEVKFPTEVVRLIVGFRSGGGMDVSSRAFQPFFEKALGGKVIVENMTAGAGNQARQYIYSQAKPDGHALYTEFQPSFLVGEFQEKGAFKVNELTPLGGFMGGDEWPLSARAGLPVKTIKELIDYSKTKPLTVAFAGFGTGVHLMALMVAKVLGVNATLVPFGSGAEAIAGVAGGHVDLVPTTASATRPFVQEGKVNVLGRFGTVKPVLFPGAPAIKDLGFPKAYLDTYIPIYGPKGLPDPVARVLVNAIKAGANDENYVKAAKAGGLVPEYFTPEQIRAMDKGGKELVEGMSDFIVAKK